jgi:hypothetical protein
VRNYRHISIVKNVSKLFKIIIHNHVLHNVKLNITQHGFTKSKSTIINLTTFLNFIAPLIRCRRQADTVYFDLSNAFDPVSHSLLLHKLRFFGFPDSYVSWFRS